MLRLICGIATVAYIFAHSPERPPTGLSDDAARWIDRTRAEVTEAAFRSGVGQEFVRHSLLPPEKAAAKAP